MIRDFQSSDMEDVLNIWLSASIHAHDFVAKEFWESKVVEMREVYLPASESYVYEENGYIKGFVSLYGETLAAIFVLPNAQRQGIGKQLIQKAQERRQTLNLSVYKENTPSIEFYHKCGFLPVKKQVDKHTGHLEVVMVWR